MTTVAIAEAKIKLAWREKYLTDGTNERGLTSPRGAYRGYWLSPRLAPDRWLRLIIDPYAPPHAVDKDQFAIFRHTDDSTGTPGFSVSIREATDVEFNCEDMWPGVGVPLAADEDWYVYIEAAYTPNTTTTANYRVANVDPHILNPDAVILGVIPMHAGDLIFGFSAMPPTAGMYDRRCIPSPTARQLVADYVDGDETWGLFDGLSKWCLGTGADARVFGEPTLDPHTLVAATKFQLSGSFYVGRENAPDVAGQYFLALNAAGPEILTGTGRGRIRFSSVVLQSDGITNLVPFADADSEGFYSDPWLQMSFSDCPPDVSYTGNLNVLCFKKKTLLTLENDPATTFPVGCQKIPEHASDVTAKNQTGTPDSLTGTTVTAQLLQLLGFINDRIETIHPTAAPGDWVLLWRSHSISPDANVTKQTSSLYFGDKGLALVHGGYIKIADGDVYAGTGAAGDDVSIMYLRSGGSGGLTFGVKSGPAAGSNWDVETGWDMYGDQAGSVLSFTGGSLFPSGGVMWLPGTTIGKMPDMYNAVVPSGIDQNRYVKHNETSPAYAGFPQTRTYYNQYSTVFTTNAKLHDEATSEWECDDAGFDAIKVLIGTAGIVVFKKHQTDIVLGVPWTDFVGAGGWTTTWTIGVDSGSGNTSIACMSVNGALYESIHLGWEGYATEESGAPGTGSDVECGCSCNFRNYHTTIPVGGDFTLDVPPLYDEWIDTAGNPQTFTFAPTLAGRITGLDHWGFHIRPNPLKVATGNPAQSKSHFYYWNSIVYES